MLKYFLNLFSSYWQLNVKNILQLPIQITTVLLAYIRLYIQQYIYQYSEKAILSLKNDGPR